MAAIGPMFGQVGYFNRFAGKAIEDKRPLQRYVDESKRLLGVLEGRLEGREWIMDDYSVADVATLGWVRNLVTFYEARELVEFDGLTQRPGLARARPGAAGGAARAGDPEALDISPCAHGGMNRRLAASPCEAWGDHAKHGGGVTWH